MNSMIRMFDYIFFFIDISHFANNLKSDKSSQFTQVLLHIFVDINFIVE